jgi:hypothetical protein
MKLSHSIKGFVERALATVHPSANRFFSPCGAYPMCVATSVLTMLQRRKLIGDTATLSIFSTAARFVAEVVISGMTVSQSAQERLAGSFRDRQRAGIEAAKARGIY